jgi:hypothetical protein
LSRLLRQSLSFIVIYFCQLACGEDEQRRAMSTFTALETHILFVSIMVTIFPCHGYDKAFLSSLQIVIIKLNFAFPQMSPFFYFKQEQYAEGEEHGFFKGE